MPNSFIHSSIAEDFYFFGCCLFALKTFFSFRRMSFQDFCKEFQKLEICNLGPDSLDEAEIEGTGKRWEMTKEHGAWVRRVNAGGCRNYLGLFSFSSF